MLAQFLPSVVRDAVAAELRYDFASLAVEWDEKQDPLTTCTVSSVDNKMVFTVYRDDDAGKQSISRDVAQALLKGKFFDEFVVTEGMLSAVAKVCDLADMTPYWIAFSRQDWALTAGNVFVLPAGVSSITDLRKRQKDQLATYQRDPLGSLRDLYGSDLPTIMAVIIEQCVFVDVDVLVGAIVDSAGGWRNFTGSPVSGTTSEGFVIVPVTQFAQEYMEACLSGLHTP